MKLVVITTRSTYVATLGADDIPNDRRGMMETISKSLGEEGDRHFAFEDDRAGWVAINPNHVVSIELREEA